MGSWHIKIEGHGQHHNKMDNDAEVMAKKFVDDLRAKGHQVSRAEFTLTGSQQDIDTGDTLSR